MTAAPAAEPRAGTALDALADLVADGDVVVLSGAGLSTDSGIPDYRGATGSLRRHTPMTYQTFTRDPRGRHRYWARSFVGWRQIRGGPAQRRAPGRRRRCRRPGLLGGVDHPERRRAAPGRRGAGRRRAARRAGPDGLPRLRGRRRPGGARRAAAGGQPALRAARRRGQPRRRRRAARRGARRVRHGRLPGLRGRAAQARRRLLRRDRAARPRRRAASTWSSDAGSLLVLGSSLTVMSGYRFVLRAAKLGIPVAIVNVGPTRGDAKADVRVDAPLGRGPAGAGRAAWPDDPRGRAHRRRPVRRRRRTALADGGPGAAGRRPRAAAAPPRRRPVRRADAPGGPGTTRRWPPPARGCSWPRPGWGSAGRLVGPGRRRAARRAGRRRCATLDG